MVSLFKKRSILFLLCLVLQSLGSARSQSYIGVNYGTFADNLPTPAQTAKLLQSTSIGKVRLYAADPAIIKALANTGIGIVLGIGNGDIPKLASDRKFATQWVQSNVLAYYPASKIVVVTVGNEVMSFDPDVVSQLLPAMQNVQDALNSASVGGKIKVSTVHAMEVMGQSEPPSAGAFKSEVADTMKALLKFHQKNGSPFMINPYPFFAYQGDPNRPGNLEFCTFQPNSGRYDNNTHITYMNMFDAQVDAVYSALKALGFKDVEIVVAETGWAHDGGEKEAGASVENAKAYNGNLISYLRSMKGTPLMPGKPVETYIFALYDENMKPGAGSEKSFGLFKPDRTANYDAGLSKSGRGSAPGPRRAPGKTPAGAPAAHRTSPKAAPGTRRTHPVARGPAAAPGAPGASYATTPAGNPVTSTGPGAAGGNPAAPTGQSGGSVGSGTAKSCRPPHSLPLALVVMAAFILVNKAHEEEDKLL
ncbi:PREDICTED: glucan endo-1,3-beta-glucosidase 7-like [Ipomoea nil]|uniref:glucan endo-1,3-beta-glucosidase 7-like n=1 Tax=Ipomoea nil TaxID=35883 RepID=UPI000901A4E0|nr:PREDICTED: glucan endo-1,3-beta-glucosidase 7-like [Ipomoea nil]